MLESGARYMHILRMICELSPDETVEIPGTGVITDRLIIYDDRGLQDII